MKVELKLIKRVYKLIFSKIDSIKFYRKQGVEIGEDCSFVGKIDFGSEPYLVKLGNKVRISNNVKFITHDGGVHVIRNLYPKKNDIDKFGNIVIGDNVFIGMESIILPGVTIGDNVIIGAGSIVSKNIPSNSVYAGIPARFIKSIEQYYEDSKDKFDFTKRYSSIEKKSYLLKKYDK